MARKGRKRKAGLRTPSGHLSRSKKALAQRSEAILTQNQPHRRQVPKELRTDQRAESVLGRLYLRGSISQAECWAGEKWRSLMSEFSIVLCTPMTKSSALASMIAEPPTAPADAENSGYIPETPEEKRERVLGRYDDAISFLSYFEKTPEIQRLKSSKSERWLDTLDAIIIREESPSKEQAFRLAHMLTALASHWKIRGDDDDRPLRGERHARPTWGHDERTIEIVRQPLAKA